MTGIEGFAPVHHKIALKSVGFNRRATLPSQTKIASVEFPNLPTPRLLNHYFNDLKLNNKL